MSLRTILNRQKNKVKDSIQRRAAKKDQLHTLTYEAIVASLSKLGWQEKESLFLQLRKQLSETGESISYAEKIFNSFSGVCREYCGKLEGLRILELGPGTNLAAGVYFVLAGVSDYTAVDALAAFPERPKEFYTNLIDELRNRPQLVGRASIPEEVMNEILTINESVGWNEKKVKYVTPVYAERMPFQTGEFDFIYSNASFEHFEEPQKVIREIHRVLKSGGFTAHVIDLRDHIDFNKPLEFLKFSPEKYVFTSPYGTNRWRASDFEKAFREAGLEIRKFVTNETWDITDEEYKNFDPFFREKYTREDLSILGVTVIARKP
ncbi:MAG: hypothetical protein C5B54_07560 [Acidobacteria bacterium]|nr:MAG: hypothetical protein C5B54_07560 [Acidobacteriota bacterium]